MNTKGTLLIYLIIILVNNKCIQAQANIYFQNNPVWGITSLCADFYPCIDNKTYNYYTNGDTIIGSFIYKKIYEKGQGFYSWNAVPPSNCPSNVAYSYIYPTPSYFIRSISRQMYIRQPNGINEQLLYDFNLSIGDTIPLTFTNYENNIKVTNIDSIYTPYGYRKRFSITGNTWAQYLIEGIGSDKGLVEPIQAPFDCGFNMTCYGLNNATYYPTTSSSCLLSVGITEYQKEFEVAIYPNPFNDFTSIKISNINESVELIIYNLYGQKVKNMNIDSNNFIFTRDNLPSGVYIISLKQKDKSIVLSKLIITD